MDKNNFSSISATEKRSIKTEILTEAEGSLSSPGKYDLDATTTLDQHLSLLNMNESTEYHSEPKFEEIKTTPLFSSAVEKAVMSQKPDQTSPFPQYSLLAGRMHIVKGAQESVDRIGTSTHNGSRDPRIFLNVNAPWSAFICGSQGSGKSHSLSCMLENCLLAEPMLGLLPNPLTALLFHYDAFNSAVGGQACEAAYLCSSGIEVTVMVSRSNLSRMRMLYGNLPGLKQNVARLTVKPLLLHQRYLNADRLITLMAAGNSDGPMPLYMQTVLQVLREMADESMSTSGIDYLSFKNRIQKKNLTPAQLGPLTLRLDLLESFISTDPKAHDWTHSPGKLTIVDLSCPFVDPDTACGLFELSLGLFLEQKMDIGRLIALDEAHKFMGGSVAANKLTESLMAAIRLQRHLACRIIIATQEPTISPRLLDLCSITIVHRFTSPEWFKTLKGHLAGVSTDASSDDNCRKFDQIVQLNVGEALLFAPSAIVHAEKRHDENWNSSWSIAKLGLTYLHIRIRNRLTADGGKSLCAV